MTETARNTAKERLISAFLSDGEPYVMSWDYRRKKGSYQEDLPILKEMIQEGLVKEVTKSNKTILYKYIGPVPVAK